MARKKKTAKVEDNPELERDLSTNAIINTSMTEWTQTASKKKCLCAVSFSPNDTHKNN